ncbi:dynein regulatory complex subunit 7 [Augochlora pura]
MQQFQKGNCFEYATFLTSLLLGQGYNAFVVSGYASREQTMCDLTRTPYPCARQPETPALRSTVQVEVSKYALKPAIEYESEFLAELEEEEQRRLQEKLKQEEEEQQRLIEELEQPLPDKYYGHRIHAWVVILPELGGLRDQEFSGPLFIEPTTGVSYNPTYDNTYGLYLGVESIWNDQNYWVNLQPFSQLCSDIVWDLTKLELWEHVLPGEPSTMRGIGEAIDEDTAILQEKHLDMPISYVQEIQISDEEFEKRYPNGRKTMFYKKTKVELYTPYLQLDGLIQKITKYSDYSYLNCIETQEIYANRSDNLVESKKDLTNDSVIDFYQRGRPDQCKEHRYFLNNPNTVDAERILEFYYVARLDGLSHLEMHPAYVKQYFIDRDDFLHYRYAAFSPEKSIQNPEDIHYRHISKIVEEFHRNETIRGNKNIATREFAIDENEIRLLYHYETGQYSRATRMFIKPPLAERGDRLKLKSNMTQGYNPSNEPEKTFELFCELDTQLKEEDQSIMAIRGAEVEMFNFLKIREDEYLSPKLLVSIFSRTRDEESMSEIMDWSLVQTEKSSMVTVDYLKPFLARLGNPEELPKQEAQSLQLQCLNDYKQVLVRRANKILQKFEECSQKVTGLQQKLLFQGEELTHEEEEEILNEMNKINFDMIALETQLTRHKNLVPEKYKMLVDHLKQSTHLAILRGTYFAV